MKKKRYDVPPGKGKDPSFSDAMSLFGKHVYFVLIAFFQRGHLASEENEGEGGLISNIKGQQQQQTNSLLSVFSDFQYQGVAPGSGTHCEPRIFFFSEICCVFEEITCKHISI